MRRRVLSSPADTIKQAPVAERQWRSRLQDKGECRTGIIRSYTDCLYPADLTIAISAFDAALRWLGQTAAEDHAAREALARHIMRRSLGGERDPDRLCDGALVYLGWTASSQNDRQLRGGSAAPHRGDGKAMRNNDKVLLDAEEQLVFGDSLAELKRTRDKLRVAVPDCLLVELLEAKIARTKAVDLPPRPSPWGA
jgi:hypothetical protein